MTVRNPFVDGGVAARYARARPPLHGNAVDMIVSRGTGFDVAIDLACGTGLSTTPLLRVATRVVGVDVSFEMLMQAARSHGVSYVRAAAEHLPFEDGTFDLATVCSGIHWFERSGVVELRRVLESEAALVVYDVWFVAEMLHEPGFAAWMSTTCAPRYPSVAKRHDNLAELTRLGFAETWAADPRFEVRMSLERLVDYLMTHSERIAAVREGRETEGEQAAFFREGLSSLYAGEDERTLMFGIWVRAFELDGPTGRSG